MESSGLREFINIMSLVIFGGILLSCLFSLVAYLIAIDRRKMRKKVARKVPGTAK